MTGTHIVLIVMVVMGFTALQTWIKHRNKIIEASSAANGDADDMLAKIDVLEERIRVLERIVTERNIDLKQQIDDL